MAQRQLGFLRNSRVTRTSCAPRSLVAILAVLLFGGLSALFVLLVAPLSAQALPLTQATSSAEYLLIGTGSGGIVGTVTAVSNWELGRNSEAVPMGGLSVPALPDNAATVQVGIGGNGDIAITHTAGTINFSNVDIYGNMGVDCAGTLAVCTDNGGFVSNSTFTGTGLALTSSNGLNGEVNLSAVGAEIMALMTEIPALTADLTLNFSDGLWDTDLTFDLGIGLTVIDITTNSNDLVLNDENLLFNGPAGAFAIVRVPDEANFNANNSNIIIGNGGIGFNNILFTSFKPDNNTHFNFNNTILNGVAFWDFSSAGEIHLDNAQGCTQLLGAKINLNDVRLNNCATLIPEPGTASLLALGLAGLAAGTLLRRRV